MTRIQGIEGMSYAELEEEVGRGGRFVFFEYCVSVLILTFKRGSDVYYVGPGQSPQAKGLPFTLLSLTMGWWGVPWGFIYTPMALFTNLSGGKNVTREVMAAIAPTAQS